MPLVRANRYQTSAPSLIAGAGLQTINGPLTLGNPTWVEFDPDLWKIATPGVAYVIFQYTSLSPSDPVIALSYLTTDTTNVTACGFTSAAFTVTSTQIAVTFTK